MYPWWNGRHGRLKPYCFGVRVQVSSGTLYARVAELADAAV